MGQFYSIPTAGGHTNPQAVSGQATNAGWGSGAASGSGVPTFILTDPTGRQICNANMPANPIIADSGVQGHAAAIATLSGQSGMTTYLAGFQVYGTGATAATTVIVSVTGLAPGLPTLHYPMSVPAGINASLQYPLNVVFPFPLPGSGTGNIVITVPDFGAGNTNSCVVAEGFCI